MTPQQAVTIVLATDEPEQAQTLQQILRRARITNPLQVFYNTQAVLDYLSQTDAHVRQSPTPPVLLLLDLSLRHNDGTDLLTHLQANDCTRHLPMMLLTSTDTGPETIPVEAHRTRVLVSKPVTPARFVEGLRTLGLSLAVVTLRQDTVCRVS